MLKNFIRKYRKEKSLSQRALADLVGISQQHLQRLETGAAPVQLKTAALISEELDSPVATLFPHITKVIAQRMPRNVFAKCLRLSDFRVSLVEAGVEILVELRHEGHFVLTDGSRHIYPFTSGDAQRLNEILLTNIKDGGSLAKLFFVFVSRGKLTAVNLGAVNYVHTRRVTYKVSEIEKLVEDASEFSVRVLFRGQAEFETFDDVIDRADEVCPSFLDLAIEMLNSINGIGGVDKSTAFLVLPDDRHSNVLMQWSKIAIIEVPRRIMLELETDQDKDATDQPDAAQHQSSIQERPT